MGFKQNLLEKIKIDMLTHQVQQTMGTTPEGPQPIDREAMRELLAKGGYDHQSERGLDFYFMDGTKHILVLDNELKIYRAELDDVAMRKNPTVKEMVSIRNAIKILSDKDVVVSRKDETLQRIRNELLGRLDLTYTPGDIEALAEEGRTALRNGYAEGLIEVLTLFAELLGYRKAPKAFTAAHHHVWGAAREPRPGEIVMEPVLLFDMMHDRLRLVRGPLSSLDRGAMERYLNILKGAVPADLEGEAVLTFLQQEVLTQNRRLT
jgi:hypothetical protein